MLVVLGLLLIIVGIQLRRGKWYGIVAGNTFKDKLIEVQKRCIRSFIYCFFVGGFLLIVYILMFFDIQTRFLIIPVIVIAIVYSLFTLYKYLKHFIKYGE